VWHWRAPLASGQGALAVTCGSGYRSSVAASLLAARRDHPVINVLGGMSAWNNAGYPTTHKQEE
jgi:rhodanese-related sulfurtransferase